MQIQHDRQWSDCRGWPIDSHANRRPAISARNMPLSADKSSNVFSPQDGPAETEHEQREPSRVKEACDNPPNGIAAAQVFIHHVSGDLHAILPALARGTSGVGGGPRFDPNVWSGRALQEVFVDLSVAVLHQCIRPLVGAFAPGHHGYQRACVLISGQASTVPFGSPVFACAGKTDPPSLLSLSQTSAGNG